MDPVWNLLLILVGLLVVGWGVLRLAASLARRPDDLGVRDGKLKECPGTPNCVSSQTEMPAFRMEPLRFEGSSEEAWQRLRRVVEGQPRTTVVAAGNTYLHVEFRTALVGYVDDVEFLLVPEDRTIHFRSASRLGRSDLGVNRRRMETLRRAFEKAAGT